MSPKFLSVEYHTQFFPRAVRNRRHLKAGESQGTTFTSTMELFIIFAVCLILAIIGIPSAVQGSVPGWILSIIGVVGIVGLVILSVSSQWGERPTYDDFLKGVFFFFVSLGIFIGIPVGMESHSFWLGASASLAGLVAGYALGIFAGLQLQRLGWFAIILNMIAAFAAIVLAGTTLLMLFLPML
ncbi:MAG: hypothetical protein A4E69_01516 [Syntrophus sp. PtaB.Bin138]|nr:MAG: hypothetical protein A4E69_01516 [Syntrophus sp. PtaB.Bin138]